VTVPPPPPYGYPPPYPGYAPARQTNTLAIAALVSALVFAPLGIVFGHVSLSQIKRTGEEGRGLALAGLIIGYVLTVLTVLTVIVAVAALYFLTNGIQSAMVEQDHSSFTETRKPPHYYLLPEFDPPGVPGANCQYPATKERAARPVKPPRTGKVPNQPAEVAATISTDLGDIGLALDNQKAPCTVNNFVSLAQQRFYDNTTCHRLTTAEQFGLLQCGDPTGTGKGGPGYQFPSEYPTNQYRLSDPILKEPRMMYPRGTLAMANAGPGTNGSQFFLVYEDSVMPAGYTAFGRIDEDGMAVLDKIAEAGVADGSDDGKPAQPLRIKAIRLG